MMKLRIIQNRKYFYTLSGVLILASVLSFIMWGIKPGIDFTGGSLLEIKFTDQRPANEAIQQSLSAFDLGETKIQPSGESDVILRFKTIDEETHQKILAGLNSSFGQKASTTDATVGGLAVVENKFESIGPIIGQELAGKARNAIILAVILIIAYIAYAFRKVSQPVTSWKYGVAAVVALIHDITIVTGLFIILGHFAGVEVDSLFITALLTILGFSVHDTIVVFDRTRENLAKHYSGSFEEVVNDSVNQTMSRSINTSLTTLLVLTTLYIFGGASIANFVLALIAGIIVGTYSSIFVASPLIVSWHNWSRRVKN